MFCVFNSKSSELLHLSSAPNFMNCAPKLLSKQTVTLAVWMSIEIDHACVLCATYALPSTMLLDFIIVLLCCILHFNDAFCALCECPCLCTRVWCECMECQLSHCCMSFFMHTNTHTYTLRSIVWRGGKFDYPFSTYCLCLCVSVCVCVWAFLFTSVSADKNWIISEGRREPETHSTRKKEKTRIHILYLVSELCAVRKSSCRFSLGQTEYQATQDKCLLALGCSLATKTSYIPILNKNC